MALTIDDLNGLHITMSKLVQLGVSVSYTVPDATHAKSTHQSNAGTQSTSLASLEQAQGILRQHLILRAT